MKRSGHDNCHQDWNPSDLSSGVANQHFVIVDSLLLDRTLADTWDTYLPFLTNGPGLHSQSSLLQFHCSLGTGWSNQGWWLSRRFTKALSKGNQTQYLPSAFPAFYGLLFLWNKETSDEVFEKENCHTCWMTISAVGLIYGHDQNKTDLKLPKCVRL